MVQIKNIHCIKYLEGKHKMISVKKELKFKERKFKKNRKSDKSGYSENSENSGNSENSEH
jgi:hypothetical protein